MKHACTGAEMPTCSWLAAWHWLPPSAAGRLVASQQCSSAKLRWLRCTRQVYRLRETRSSNQAYNHVWSR